MCKINHCDVKYNGDDVQRTGSGDVTALFILTCQPSPLLLPVYLNQGVRKCEREEVDAPTTTFYTPSPPLRPAETYLPRPHSPTRHTLCLRLHPRQDVKDPWDPPSSTLSPPRLSDASSWVTFSGGSSFSSPPVVGGTQHDRACFHFFPLFFFFIVFEYADGFGLHH